MKLIAISQRVTEETRYVETRDALDERWAEFLWACGLCPLLLPNHPATAGHLLATVPITGMLLTGGSQHPLREATEKFMLQQAQLRKIPVLGVCHGMQVIQQNFGIALKSTPGHVKAEQDILVNGKKLTVNSYHDYGTKETVPELEVWAKADDGVVKALRHTELPWLGIMWHPERITPFADRDIALFKEHFK